MKWDATTVADALAVLRRVAAAADRLGPDGAPESWGGDIAALRLRAERLAALCDDLPDLIRRAGAGE